MENCTCSRPSGLTENAGYEIAGHKIDGPSSGAWKCKIEIAGQ